MFILYISLLVNNEQIKVLDVVNYLYVNVILSINIVSHNEKTLIIEQE